MENKSKTDENYDMVRATLNEVKSGLGPYVLNEFALGFGSGTKKHLKALKNALGSDKAYKAIILDSDSAAIEQIDLAGWLKVMDRRWSMVFDKKLGRSVGTLDRDILNAKGYLIELIHARNAWAHDTEEYEITDYDAFRIADTASRLLSAIEAKEESEAVRVLMLELGSKLYTPDKESSEASSSSRIERQSPIVDLQNANLQQMYLKDRNLRYANLTKANMSNCILWDENLRDAQLNGANLRDAELSNAKLSGSRLKGADLSGAKLGHAVLSRAHLRRAKLNNAILEFADLRHANLSKADADSANFRGAKL